MIIYVTSGAGEGSTDISAFDAALMAAGIADFNLINLSSIIPEGSEVVAQRFKSKDEDYGNRLYVVLQRNIQNIPGREAWAGLGWTQDRSGRGFFVEHEAAGKKEIEKFIEDSLEDMKSRRLGEFGENKTLIRSSPRRIA